MNLNINVNLDNPRSIDKTMLFYSVTYGKTRFRIKSGKKVLPKFWNKKNQAVRTTASNAGDLNAIIKKHKAEIESVCNRLIFEEKPIVKEDVYNRLKFTQKANKSKFSFFDYYEEWMRISQLRVSLNTLKGYKTTFNHLKAFDLKTNFDISFENINESFIHLFGKYILQDLKSYNNNLWKNVKNLKAFMKWAHEKGFSNNEYYLRIKIKQETDKDIVALSLEQLKEIENLKLDDRLDKVRDLFLIECYCGLRFSDIQNLKKENIKDGKINVLVKKTKQRLIIPAQKKLIIIFDKYFLMGKDLPKITNQKMNDYLKEIGELAELDEEFEFVKYRGNERVAKTVKKYERLTTHTARHTFITLSLLLGLDHETIMKVVGHQKYNTLKKYIHYNEAHVASQMSKWDKV
jgi:integrase